MSSFQFKKFTIQHREDVFKFGTDAALLATWVDISNSSKVLEIGTGTGVISLMLAQRNSSANYTGIDISKNAIELADQNFETYPLPSKIKFMHSSLQHFYPEEKFDLIVSNPPFFESSTKSPSELKNTSRHTDLLSLHDLLRHSKRLLTPTGTINLIYPVRYLKEIKAICQELGMFPQQIVFTRSNSSKPIKRVLISIGQQETIAQEQELNINGNYTGYSLPVFKMLQPFLLKL